jgi:hypothetical protein
MEQEVFLSGYCRAADQSRMVAVVTQDGVLTDVDCGYPHCPYAPGCPIAEKINELLK